MSRDRDTWAEMVETGQPRECAAGCGKPVRLGQDTIWFDSHLKLTWHWDCRVEARRAA